MSSAEMQHNNTNKLRNTQQVVILALLFVTAGVAFGAGVWFANESGSPHNDEEFDVFWQSWDILENEYYFELPEDESLVYGAIQGLMATTGNPYTFFVPPTLAERDRQSTAGEFGGIGAYVSENQEGQLIIASPFEGSPAADAGLKANDVILAVDGTSLEGWTLDEAVDLIRGEIGTRVLLTMFRPTDESEFDVTIVRARVELPTVISGKYEDVGYVRLFSFNGLATSQVEQAIADLQADGITSLIFDLRGNGGGLLDQAVGVSDLFLPEGVVVTQQRRSGKEIEYRAVDGQLAEDIPLVVLIDGGSASASEVVAGALHDYERAVLIGETSYGKGSVQHVHDMADGSQLHVTVAVWLTPNETVIEGQGLTPDIPVSITEELTENDQDPFVMAALAYFDELEE